MLPAWVSEPAPAERYAQHEGQDRRERDGRDRRDGRERKRKRPMPNRGQSGLHRPTSKSEEGDRHHDRRARPPRRRQDQRRFRNLQSGSDHRPPVERPLPPIAVKFLPRVSAFENVVAQIKSGSVAYSLFALARLFLEKPVGYEVCLTAKQESPLFQLGDNGIVSADREFLERNAFRFAQHDFYKIEVAETDPIKGNFSNVARCRLSGTLLRPTNHHSYQPQLRSLYEQRFSRRMSFADYQRQIEIVSDLAQVERWKEEARKVTTYTTLRAENPATFSSAVETERHFRSHYLPALIRSRKEVTIGGAMSRH